MMNPDSSRKWFFIIFLFFALPASADNIAKVPDAWRSMPEEGNVSLEENEDDLKNEKNLAPVVEKMFRANQTALDQTPFETPPAFVEKSKSRPADWVPWHFSGFATDFGITLQGLLGILTIKETPAVQVYWSLQGPVRAQDVLNLESLRGDVAVKLNDDTSLTDIDEQIEPVVLAATAAGDVKDVPAFKSNLRNSIVELRTLMTSIQSRPGTRWWMSRFRFDCIIDLSGRILPVVSAGAETRFRLEWFRLQPSGIVQQAKPIRYHASSPSYAKVQQSLQDLVTSMEAILQNATEEESVGSGFQPYFFKIGLGVVANGNVAMAKGMLTLLGHVYFSTNNPVPVIRPTPPKIASIPPLDVKPVLMLEENAAPTHLDYATKKLIRYETFFQRAQKSPIQTVYQIEAEHLKKGIRKAIRIGGFFARQAAKANQGKWKVFLLRCDYDASISGDLGLVGIGGTVSAEITYFNESF